MKDFFLLRFIPEYLVEILVKETINVVKKIVNQKQDMKWYEISITYVGISPTCKT